MIELVKLSKEDWPGISERCAQAAFGEYAPAKLERVDFVLMIHRKSDMKLMGYATMREHDGETLYWQYGGAFPGTAGTSLSFAGYLAVLEWSKSRYKRITTVIENTNTVMLKFAMKVGFKIVGVRAVGGSVLLEHVWGK